MIKRLLCKLFGHQVVMRHFYPRMKMEDCECARCGRGFVSCFNQPGEPCIKTPEEFFEVNGPTHVLNYNRAIGNF